MRYHLTPIAVVQSLSPFWLFATPWTLAHQASLSFTISSSLLKLMSIELMMPCNQLILCCPLLLLPSVFPSIKVFFNESLYQVAKVLELQLHHQSFQWMFRVDFLYDGLVWSPCSPISTSHWYNVCMSRLYRNFFLFFFLKDFNCFKENCNENSVTFNLVFFATVQVYW